MKQFLRDLVSKFRRKKRPAGAPARPRARPCLEALEDRLVPAGFQYLNIQGQSFALFTNKGTPLGHLTVTSEDTKLTGNFTGTFTVDAPGLFDFTGTVLGHVGPAYQTTQGVQASTIGFHFDLVHLPKEVIPVLFPPGLPVHGLEGFETKQEQMYFTGQLSANNNKFELAGSQQTVDMDRLPVLHLKFPASVTVTYTQTTRTDLEYGFGFSVAPDPHAPKGPQDLKGMTFKLVDNRGVRTGQLQIVSEGDDGTFTGVFTDYLANSLGTSFNVSGTIGASAEDALGPRISSISFSGSSVGINHPFKRVSFDGQVSSRLGTDFEVSGLQEYADLTRSLSDFSVGYFHKQ